MRPGGGGQWFTDYDAQSDYGANNLIYCGYYFDAETQLYYVRNRTYNPVLGRWIQRDPIGYEGGINLYEYVGGRAVGSADPSGNKTFKWGASHVFNPGQAGIVIATDINRVMEYEYKFSYRGEGGYPVVGSVRSVGWHVKGVWGFHNIDIGVDRFGVEFGYHWQVVSRTMPWVGDPHSILLTVTNHLYHDYGANIGINIGPISKPTPTVHALNTDMGTWYEGFRIVASCPDKVTVIPLPFWPFSGDGPGWA